MPGPKIIYKPPKSVESHIINPRERSKRERKHRQTFQIAKDTRKKSAKET